MKTKSIITPDRNIVLIIKQSGIPYLMPNVYLVTAKSNLSEKRLLNYATVIKRILRFFESLDINLDEAFASGDFSEIFKLIPTFFDQMAGQLELSDENFNLHVNVFKGFTIWAINRYLTKTVKEFDRLKKLKLNNLTKCEDLFSSFILKEKKSRDQFKVIDDNVIDFILEMWEPFAKKVTAHQIRNYLIIRVLFETGIRLGELLNLKTSDLIIENGITYVKIIDTFFPDSRSDRAKLKNLQSSRIIALSESTSELIEVYIHNYRRHYYPKIEKKTSHPFLFTSKLGKPLSKSNVYFIFDTLNVELKKVFATGVKITPHMLRHTFAYNFLKFLIEEKNLDMERAKDELRITCGWSPSSVMPQHYAGKYIWESANTHNISRINSIYGK